MPDPLRLTEPEALAAWAARIRADHDQVARLREGPESNDFYAPVAARFRADPHRTDEPVLDILRSLVRTGDTWLDIGAGGGRYALPLALLAEEVIAVEPSEGMAGVLREGMAENGIANIRHVASRWPGPVDLQADCSLIANVGNDIEDIGPFLDAMEAATRRLCLAIMPATPPASFAYSFWPPVHGEERAALPALPEFLALLLARGKLFDVRLSSRPSMAYPDVEMALGFLRQQLFIQPGGAKDNVLQGLAAQSLSTYEGQVALSPAPVTVAVVTWSPRQ